MSVSLREVLDTDLPIFFEQQLDHEANFLAAFTRKDPSERGPFDRRWARILNDPSMVFRTIISEGQVAGHVALYPNGHILEVTYWIGKSYWGKGIATQALKLFLADVLNRPLQARVAKDNPGSIRVLEKNGFTVVREESGFAEYRQEEVAELLMILDPVITV